jgi:site-specific DNA-cytosine methylase
MRTVALCEIEAFAIANLVAKMEAGLMDPAPIWTDLKTFPWDSFRDRVDILTGGYPCQPFSSAGLRKGSDDPRHLWPYIRDGIRRMAPRLCLFENVEGHISLGLREVIAELEELGYQTAWGIFSAAEVGAPHQRKRVFIMANNIGARLERFAWYGAGENYSGRENSNATGSVGESGFCNVWPSRPGELVNSEHDGHIASEIARRDSTSVDARWQNEPQEHRQLTGRRGSVWPSRPGQPQHTWEPPRVVVNSESKRASSGRELCGTECGQEQRLSSESDDAGAVVGNAESWMSGQSSTGDWRESAGGTSEGAENMGNAQSRDGQWSTQGEAGHAAQPDEGMGESTRELPHGSGTSSGEAGCSELADSSEREIEPTLGRDIDGTPGGLDHAELQISCDSRVDELRLLGNGVVPATAEKAFKILINELHENRRTTSA